MDSLESALHTTFGQLFKSIDLCLERSFRMPSLILLYSGMDIAAWLGDDEGGRSVRERFTAFAETYILPDSRLECTALDLYGARCGILHTYSPESALSQKGLARAVFYAWGNARVEDLRESFRRTGRSDLVGIHIDHLRAAFQDGIGRFLVDVRASPERLGLLEKRTSKEFSELPTDLMRQFLEGTTDEGGA